MKTSTQRLFKPAEPAVDLMPISDHPEYAAVHDQLRALEAAHAEKSRERGKLLARIRGAKIKRNAVERAADLLKGGRIDPIPPAGALAAIDEELHILQAAIGQKSRELDVISGELSFAVSMSVQPEYLEAMRGVRDHLQAAADAYQRAANLPIRLHRAGYRASAVVMPEICPPSLTVLRAFELPTMRQRLAELEALR